MPSRFRFGSAPSRRVERYNALREEATVRELHINTSALIRAVTRGQTFVIELRGKPVAESRPFTERAGRPLPDREAWIRKLPISKTDAGRIMDEDRS